MKAHLCKSGPRRHVFILVLDCDVLVLVLAGWVGLNSAIGVFHSSSWRVAVG